MTSTDVLMLFENNIKIIEKMTDNILVRVSMNIRYRVCKGEYKEGNHAKGVVCMRIDGIQKVAQLYSSNNVSKTEKKRVDDNKDRLQISQAGRDYQIAKKAVAEAPDIREELVADIKSRVEAGTYEVSGDAFAQKVIERYNQLMR